MTETSLKSNPDNAMAMSWSFLFLQVTSWIFCAYLFVGQVLPLIDYDEIGVKALKTQESAEIVTPVGVAFYKGFCLPDALVYLPLFVVGLLLQFHCVGILGLHPIQSLSQNLLSAAYGITIYWPIMCLSAVYHSRGHWELSDEAEREYWTVLPIIAAWGVVSLTILSCQKVAHPDPGTTLQAPYVFMIISFLQLSLVSCGIGSAFLYLVNDILQCAMNPSHSWQSTSVSDLASADTAHVASQYLLLGAAICLILFGVGLVAIQLDIFLGLLQIAIGICNCATATIFRLEAPIGIGDGQQFRSLPIASKLHIVIVMLTVSLSLLSLTRDAGYTRQVGQLHKHHPSSSWAPTFTAVLMLLAVIGAFMAPKYPEWIGLFERLSVYAIQAWTASLSLDCMYRIRRTVLKRILVTWETSNGVEQPIRRNGNRRKPHND